MNPFAFMLSAVAVLCSFSGFAAASPLPEGFTFATRQFGNWNLEAKTAIDWSRKNGKGTPLPTVEYVSCGGTFMDVEFRINGEGQIDFLRLGLLGARDKDGDREEQTLLGDHLWLFIDDENWEFSNSPATQRFKNVSYGAPGANEIIIPIWRGHQAVRKNGVGPWLHVSRIYEMLIAARKLEWSFKSRDWNVVDRSIEENALPENWESRRYPVEHVGLSQSIDWCAEQVISSQAYILPTELLGLTKE